MSSPDELPIPDYDQLPVGDLLHRLRTLTQAQLAVVIEYEKTHAGRPQVLVAAEARLDAVRRGAKPSGGAPDASHLDAPAPDGGSRVSPQTSGPPINPPSQGVPSNPAQPR